MPGRGRSGSSESVGETWQHNCEVALVGKKAMSHAGNPPKEPEDALPGAVNLQHRIPLGVVWAEI